MHHPIPIPPYSHTTQSLGLTGQVVLVHDDGDVVVWINGCRWTYNPACLLHAPGEEVEDCQGQEYNIIYTQCHVHVYGNAL